MARFCPNCGAALGKGNAFCPECGTALPPPGSQAQTAASQQQPPVYSQAQSYGGAYAAAPQPGYSKRINDPEILAAVRKNKKAGAIFALFLVPLPFLGFTVYSLVSDSMELSQGLLYGGIVSAVFLLFALHGMLQARPANAYDAVVLEQKQRDRSERRENSTEFYTEYITLVETAEGKKKKIVESSRGIVVAYHYLKVGDRFMYHPQFNFPYEHYDKSKAPYIACVACGTHNAVCDDRCKKCGTPLLK